MKEGLTDTLENAKKRPIDREEALYLFQKTEAEEDAEQLFEAARYVRHEHKGDTFKLVGGIASVLQCKLKPNCIYCPYWREQKNGPLSIKEILLAVDYITSKGIKEFHLSGGTTLGSEGKDILEIVQAISQAGYTGLRIDVNCGAAMSMETLLQLKKYQVKLVRSVFETLNPDVFAYMKPGDDLQAKKNFAKNICEAGLQFGTGILAGLSSEDTKYQDYVDFLFELKEYSNLNSIYVSKFYPFDTIALKNHPECSALEAARVVAVARLVHPDIDISSAQGWSKGQGPSSYWAGGGNEALGIHINRTPAYIDTSKRGEDFTYLDNIEIMDRVEKTKCYYTEQGMKVAF